MTDRKLLSDFIVMAQEGGYERLRYLIRAVAFYPEGDSARSLEANCQGGMVDLLDFLASLPERLGYGSEIEFILGYEPVTFHLPDDGAAEVKAWHSFKGRSFGLTDQPDYPSAEDLHDPVSALIGEVAEFALKRRRIAQAQKGVRKERAAAARS